MDFTPEWDAVLPSTPVLVGVGQKVDRRRGADAASPASLIGESARLAVADAGIAEIGKTGKDFSPDVLCMVRLVFDTTIDEVNRLTQYANPPASVARAAGLEPGRLLYNEGGGASPQRSINEAAEWIARGEANSVLVCGGEALATQYARHSAGKQGWEDDIGGDEPEYSGKLRMGLSDNERAHKLYLPVNCYPLYANGLRRRYGQTVAQHLQACAELFSPLSQVAAKNPLSWFGQAHSAAEIATVDDDNRWVGLPYPKYLNAIMRVNMAASVLLCSWAEAERLGVPRQQRIFLHGCSQAHETWNLVDRVDFESAPAIGLNVRQALDMAGIGVDDLDMMDIYSCFPSAVQAACDSIGIAHDDGRGLTLAGGLPYFGGPGNNYAMHSVAEAVLRLRRQPDAWALVTANGGYLTKHATGVYSGIPRAGQWRAPDYQQVQREVDALDAPRADEEFEGEVRVETYTVAHGRTGPNLGLVMGLSDDGRRTVAQVPAQNSALLSAMMTEEWLDRRGCISRKDGLSTFSGAA